MFATLQHILSDNPKRVRRNVISIYLFLIFANLLVWGITLVVFRPYPLLLGTAAVAYSFGLRHAVDADHIAAIDNVTRKLIQEGKRPVTVGFFFALGHSTIVILMSVGIVLASVAIKTYFPTYEAVGNIVGTLVSTFFLFGLAAINTVVLINVYHTFQAVKRGEPYREEELESILNQRGFTRRLFRPLLKLVDRGWKMYPVGVVFGLGFDTASEVGLLGIAAASATQGMPIWTIMLFPALFTVGMSLVDTTDGVLMLGAYNWAAIKPVRKLYYNLTVTTISVLVAVFVGGIEALGLLGDELHLQGPFWTLMDNLNNNFGLIGYSVIGLFVATWLISTVVYNLKGYDQL